MSEPVLIFGVIFLTTAVMLWLLSAFRKLLRARETYLETEGAPVKAAKPKVVAWPAERPARQPAQRSVAA